MYWKCWLSAILVLQILTSMDVTVCVIQYYTDQWVVHINMPRLSPASLAIKIVNGNDFRIFLHNHVFRITHIFCRSSLILVQSSNSFLMFLQACTNRGFWENQIFFHTVSAQYTLYSVRRYSVIVVYRSDLWVKRKYVSKLKLYGVLNITTT